MKGVRSLGDAAPALRGDPPDFLHGSAQLVGTAGLHARPAVRLTQRAKAFEASIEMALSRHGPWTDAKSPVPMMRIKAPPGAELVFRTAGPDAAAALQAMLDVVRDPVGEG